MIISEDLEGEALQVLVVNKIRGTFRCAAVKAPEFGDRRKAVLGDIATLVGANPVFEDLGINLANIKISDLGEAKKVVITKDNTTIIEGAGSSKDIKGKIDQIKAEIDACTSDYDKDKLRERLAKMCGGVAKINAGASTETEMKEKKARIEDAIQATKVATDEGIIVGGGVSLVRAAHVLDKVNAVGDEKIGVEIVRKALEAPLKQIAQNSGMDGELVLNKVKEEKNYNFGFNGLTGKCCDLIEAGIVDPVKVVKTALKNGASISSLLLTTEAMVADAPEKV